MKCPNCGAENPLGTEVCISCGGRIFWRDSEVSGSNSPESASSRQSPSRNCVSCGRAIAWDASLCQYCGHDYRHQQTRGQPVPRTTPSKGTSVGTIVAGIIIAFVIIAVILAVIFFAFPQFSGSTATLNISVNSTHILLSISYNVYVDGSLIDSNTLGPGQYMQYSYTYHWTSSDPTTVTVSATSTGGGFGGESDSKAVTVTDGGTYTINLYV